MPTTDELEQRIEQLPQEIMNSRDEQFENLEQRITNRIKNLEQMIQNETNLEEELDHIQPYDRDISEETRPQLSSAGLKEYNQHITHLSNHELHQVKSIHEKDHRKPVATILDEPLGNILDKTINFMVYSFDSYQKKIYEAELLENSKGKRGFYDKLKVYAMATILFIRDDRNIIYIGFIMIFLSIIIYFTNIITE